MCGGDVARVFTTIVACVGNGSQATIVYSGRYKWRRLLAADGRGNRPQNAR